MEVLEMTYKGWKIQYREVHEDFSATSQDEDVLRHGSLKALKMMIDKFQKKSFKRIPIYYRDYWGHHWHRGEITSIVSTSFGMTTECWITFEGKNKKERRKESIEHLIIASPENKEITDKILLLEQKIDSLKAEISECEKQLVKAKIEDVIE